ncbi:hypothetical protein ACIBSW_13960 [Actinoplanes sp. NPDC049668]|uniref:hypothetical protein n=1 Tax=unclassified Actinoplanes TaxID=2626549 RepID=UPI0033B397BD
MQGETTDPFTDLLSATLERRAGAVDGGPRFAAADVVRAGNRRIRRRRVVAGAAAAAVVAAVLTGSLVARPSALPPSRPQPSPSVSAIDVPVEVLAGNTVYRADGSRVALGLPGGRTAQEAVRVRWGWVVTAAPAGDGLLEAWFVPDGGTPRRVGTAFGGFAVSPDNDVLVVAHESDQVVAYALPSLREIGRRAFPDGIGPVVLGVSSQGVLVKGAQGDGTPARGATWNLRSGSVAAIGSEVEIWGMSNAGQVLRREGDCVNLVPITESPPQSHARCGGELGPARVRRGEISPDGRWAALEVGPADGATDPTTVLARTADLTAGRLLPVPTGGPAGAELSWLTGDTFVLETPTGRLLCRAGDRCQAVVEPPGLAESTVVGLRGN